MSTLYVIGDSFSAIEMDNEGIDRVWPALVRDKLGVTNMINNSMIGASQDYTWFGLVDWRNHIKPDDYLIVTLTHPSRQWFVHDDPTLGKAEHIREKAHVHGYDPLLDKTAEAAAQYIEFLQRPELDILHLENRLAWLAYQSRLLGWRKPLVLLGFKQKAPYAFEYSDVRFSKGDLSDDISHPEYKINVTPKDYNNFMLGEDPRFNHMCLSNHEILAEKIAQSFINDTELDLTDGSFKQEILNRTSVDDPDFIANELCLRRTNRRKNVAPEHRKAFFMRGWTMSKQS